MFQISETLIRPLAPADRDCLYVAIRESMDTVGRWMSWCHPDFSLQDTEQWIALCQSNWQTGTDREFGIFDASSGEALGCVGINQINVANNFGNLGYWVRAGRTCHGVALAAAQLAAEFAFRELQLSRLEIVARVDNLASRRVAEKLGCQFECVARNRLVFRGQPYDAAVHSLVPEDVQPMHVQQEPSVD